LTKNFGDERVGRLIGEVVEALFKQIVVLFASFNVFILLVEGHYIKILLNKY